MGNHYFRVTANSLNWRNGVLHKTSYTSMSFSLWFGAVRILYASGWDQPSEAVRNMEPLVSGAPSPYRELEMQQQAHRWKELFVPAVSSPLPSRPFLPSLTGRPPSRPITSLKIIVSLRFSTAPMEWALLRVFLHLTGRGNCRSCHPSLVLFCFSSNIVTLYPRESGSAFTHVSHTTEPSKILATKY